MTSPTENLAPLLERAAESIRGGRDFFIAVHRNPDGDSLGCALAMASVLKRLGKRVYIYSHSPLPENISFLPGYGEINAQELPPAERVFDTAVMMECSSPSRGGEVEHILGRASSVINIDHHRTFEPYGTVNCVDPLSSSAAEIVYRLIADNLKMGLTPDEASCLYVGVATDTGRFLYPATTAQTHRAAADFIEAGAAFADMNAKIFMTKAYPALKLLGRALEKLWLEDAGRTAVSVLTVKDFEDCGAAAQHTEEIVNHGLMAPGVEVSVLFREEPERITVNFRSRGNRDVSLIAAGFGGGGHRNAAGCKLSHKALSEVMTEILRAVSALYE